MSTSTYPRIEDKSVAELTDGGASQDKAPDFRGRVMAIPADKAKLVTPENSAQMAKEMSESAAKSDYSQQQGFYLQQVREHAPDYNRAKAATIANAIVGDLQHFSEAAKAAKDDRHVRITNPDGSFQQGVIVGDANGKPAREGTWVAVDEKGTTRQTAGFKDGQLHGESRAYTEEGKLAFRGSYNAGTPTGTHYQYNDQGEVIHRASYDDKGQRVKAEDVDPKEAAQQRRDAQMARSISFGR